MKAWQEELKGDDDEEFLLNGIEHGFDIIDPSVGIQQAYTKNYHSATCPKNKLKVEQQIKKEISEGRYIITEDKPVLISALGAIAKPDSDELRLIHDCSQPKGKSLNDYVHYKQKLKYQTIQDAVELLSPNAYLAKCDLKSAYRSVPISKFSRKATGLKWIFVGDSKPTYITDSALPFGSSLAPQIFSRLTQAVRRMMKRRGYRIIAFLDDFLICEKTKERCKEALQTLMALLRKLGFAINYNKVVMPTQKLCFLGINICSKSFTLEFPQNKVEKFMDILVQFASWDLISC